MSRRNFLNNIRPKKHKIKLKWSRYKHGLRYVSDIHKKLHWSIVVDRAVRIRDMSIKKWRIDIFLVKNSYRITVGHGKGQHKLSDAIREAEKVFAKIRKKF